MGGAWSRVRGIIRPNKKQTITLPKASNRESIVNSVYGRSPDYVTAFAALPTRWLTGSGH